MKVETLSVTGMSCSACAGHVANALSNVPGTSNIDVSLEDGSATLTVDTAKTSIKQLIAAIEEEGYAAVPMETQ